MYEIEFTRFKIRDMDSGNVLFEINKQSGGYRLVPLTNVVIVTAT